MRSVVGSLRARCRMGKSGPVALVAVAAMLLIPAAAQAYSDNYAVECPNDIFCLESNPGHNWTEAKTQNWGTDEKGHGYEAQLCLKWVSHTSGTGMNRCSNSYLPVELPGSSSGQFYVTGLHNSGLPWPYWGYTLQYNVHGPAQISWGWWNG